MKFKFFGEKVRQALNVSATGQKDWKPTSNGRNLAMVEEARTFALQIKALHKDLVACEKAIAGALGTVKTVLSTNLPKAYEESSIGLGVNPVDSNDRIVGVNVAIESLTSTSNETKQRLEDEVLGPLEQWLSAYRTIKARNKKCEEARLDLDVKRRALADVEAQYAKAKEKAEKGGGSEKATDSSQRDTEKLEYKRQTESDKAVRATQRYVEIEAEVFNALLTLIRDTTVLREYAAAALLIYQKCFETSYCAFDLEAPTSMPNMPAPALPPPAPVLALGWNGNDGSMGGSAPSSTGGALSVGALSGGGAPAMLKSQTLQNNAGMPTFHPTPQGRQLSGGGHPGASSQPMRQGQGVDPMRQSMPAAFSSSVQKPPSMSRPTTAYGNPFGETTPQPSPSLKQQRPTYASGPAPAPNAPYSQRLMSPIPTKHQFKMPITSDLPPPPAWYNEAKMNSRPPTAYDKDSDSDDDTNPFR